MELWFILSLVAAVFAGLHIFVQKVGSARGYNSSLLNGYSVGLSSAVGFVVAGFFEGFGEISLFLIAFSFVSGVAYIVGTNLRGDALKYVDATIFLPLHKFISPLIALVIGLLFFDEFMSAREWMGIILGITVPLFLISSSEKTRQNHLTKGLLLMFFSAVFAAGSAALNKEGTNIFSSVLLFASTANFFASVVGILIYKFRRKDVEREITETHHHFDRGLIMLSAVGGIVQVFSFGAFILAFSNGGPLAIVYTIHSLYIVIPIALSVIFYNEHWNMRKAIAVVLSIGAIFLMK